MTTPDPAPESEPLPRPAALRTRNQVLAIIGILLAAAVPIALAYGLDVCPVLSAVGVKLDACERILTPVEPEPEALPPPPPSPPSMRDAGSK